MNESIVTAGGQPAEGERTGGAPDSAEKLSVVGYINKYRVRIMGVAAFLILLFHQWGAVLPQLFPNHPEAAKISAYILSHGFCGVDIFFLVSGIGLVWSADKHSVGGFYLRRLKRVYVPFLITYAVFVPATGGSFVHFLSLVSGYSFLFKNMYSVSWFVPAILILYLVFPLYNFLLKKLRFTVAVTAGVLVLWYLGARFLPIRADLLGFYNRIPIFLLGVMLGRLEKTGKFPKTRWLFIAAAPFFALGALAVHRVEVEKKPLLVRLPNCFLPTLCFAFGVVLTIAFVLGLAHRAKVSGRITDILTAPFKWLGKVSLAVYLAQVFTVKGVAFRGRSVVSASTGSTFWDNVLLLAVAVGIAWLINAVTELLNEKVLRLPGTKK